MVESRRRRAATAGNVEMDEVMVTSEALSPPVDVEAIRKTLRQRWELASVLNFLHVFEPVIESDLNISAEDVENALIKQNSTLAELHIVLLKGILPSTKTLKDPDSWMVALSKTLSEWWPWVGQGDFPLSGDKGEEISLYKKLDPTSRLLILKALCEVRADEYDAVSYINDALKNGTAVSDFRKEKLAGDGNGISFWYDGNDTIGYRLYREVKISENQRARGRVTLPEINSQWETLATNLEEFQNIENEFSSSKNKLEVAISKTIAADIIPVLEKRLKKKLRALKKQERQQMLLNGFRNSGITRSCRNNKPVDYKFDDYDRSIKEAIQYANKRKANEEQKLEENGSNCRKRMVTTANEPCNSNLASGEGESSESDAGINNYQGQDDNDESSAEEYDVEEEDDDKVVHGDMGKVDSKKHRLVNADRPKGLRFSRRLAGIPGHTVPESLNLGAKNRSRQRPSVNTAIESVVVPDSEDESTPEDCS